MWQGGHELTAPIRRRSLHGGGAPRTLTASRSPGVRPPSLLKSSIIVPLLPSGSINTHHHKMLRETGPDPPPSYIPVLTRFSSHTGLTGPQQDLEYEETYSDLLSVDFSSACNTILPNRLLSKLCDLGLSDCLLRDGPLPEAENRPPCLLSPSNRIRKFADDTTVVERPAAWCSENNLILNTKKTQSHSAPVHQCGEGLWLHIPGRAHTGRPNKPPCWLQIWEGEIFSIIINLCCI